MRSGWHIVTGMHSFLEDIPVELRLGGVVSVPVLRRFDIPKNTVATLTRRGELIPIRRNWYALPGANDEVVRAVRSGGVLGCVSALVFRGAWQPNENRIHVYRTQKGRRGSTNGLGWCPVGTRVALDVAVAPIDLATQQVLRCGSDRDALVLMESLVNRRHVGREEAVRLLGSKLGARLRAAESGTETMVRYGLEERGIPVRSQVTIRGIGRVDLLVGDRLVIEVDSRQHHHNEKAYHSDRRRDQQLLAQGYLVVRVTWEQVNLNLVEVEELIQLLVSRGDHLRR